MMRFWRRWGKEPPPAAPSAPPIDEDAEREKEADRRPRVAAYELGTHDDFDFFPQYDATKMTAGSPEREAMEELKAGTYTPLMKALEYSMTHDKRTRTYSAALQDNMDGAVQPLHGDGHMTFSAASRPGPSMITPAMGFATPGFTGEGQRIEQLEQMYGPGNRIPLRRKYYANPRQYYDHVLFADGYSNSFAGEVIDTLVDFVMGEGVYPSLALRQPSAFKKGGAAGDDEGADDPDGPSGSAGKDKSKTITKQAAMENPAKSKKDKEKDKDTFINGNGEDVDKADEDEEADKEKLAEGQHAIGTLMQIDEWYSDTGPKAQDEYFDVALQNKIKSIVTHMLVFGRACIVKERWEHLPKVEDDVEFEQGLDPKPLPNVLKVLHPIEMGLTEVELYTGKVAGLWISNDQPYIPMGDMLYFVNGYSSPMIGAATYGYSRLQRCIEHFRLYRRLLARNVPQYLKTSATGMGAFVMNTTGYPAAVRESIRQSLTSMYRTGEIAVIDYANTDDFEWKEFKVTTDINALVQLEQTMLSSMSTVLGVPHSIVFDSAESRATLIGRIVTFTNTTVKSLRKDIGRQLVQQWWLPNMRKTQAEEFLKEYTVEARFRDHTLETKLEKVERLLQEIQINPYKDSYLGEELGIDDYASKIDSTKRDEQAQLDKDMMEAEIMASNAQSAAGGKEGGKGAP